MLVFAVLCLTIFTVVSYVSAMAEQNLITAEVKLVKAYHAADTLAEIILSEIIEYAEQMLETPETILGVDITSYWDWGLVAEIVSFACFISDNLELYVVVAIGETDHTVLTWQMRQIGEWEADERLNVWQGDLEEDFLGSW